MAQKKYTRQEVEALDVDGVVNFAQEQGLDQEDVRVLRKEKMKGKVLEGMTRDDFMKGGMKMGPATEFMMALDKVFGRRSSKDTENKGQGGGSGGDMHLLLAKERAEKEKERAEKELAQERAHRFQMQGKRPDASVSPSPTELMTRVEEKEVAVWWESKAEFTFPWFNADSNQVPAQGAKATGSSKGAAKAKKPKLGKGAQTLNNPNPIIMSDGDEAVVEAAFHPLFEQVFKQARQKSSIFWFDGHETYWLKSGSHGGVGLAPDAVACDIPVVDRPVAAHVLAIHDNKQRRCTKKKPFTGFTNDDKGKLVRYLARVLVQQPWRTVISGSLFDGRYAQCFRFRRRENVLEAAPALDCSTETGLQAFSAYLTSREALSWTAAPVLPMCGELLGAGATAYVYRHIQFDCVVKVPGIGKEAYTQRERMVLTEANVKSDHFIQLCEQDDGSASHLLLTPICQPVQLESWRLSPLFLLPLFDGPSSPLQQLHHNRFVHMDIRPENVLMGPKGVVLVDGSAIRSMDVEAPFDHGTLFCASRHVLSAVEGKAVFKCRATDDLEAVARCAFVMTQMRRKEYHREVAEAGRDPERISKFWREVKQAQPFWSHVFVAARDGAESLSKAFRDRFAGTVDE